jgi:hypothetical protein
VPRGRVGSVGITAGFIMVFVSTGYPDRPESKPTNVARRAKSAAAQARVSG